MGARALEKEQRVTSAVRRRGCRGVRGLMHRGDVRVDVAVVALPSVAVGVLEATVHHQSQTKAVAP